MDDLLAAFRSDGPDPVLERTAGDEAQGAFEEPAAALSVVLWALRDGGWHIGIGAGAGRLSPDRSPRAGTGPAFIRAREAVEASKKAPISIAVRSEEREERAGLLEGLLRLYGVLSQRRTARQWEIIDAYAKSHSASEAASVLGISDPAVSQSLRSSAWREESATHPLAVELLGEISR
ncbi:SatD family protein [Actinomyces sp. B33]|nr:SatD family protein [Actinomyces sp. B33]